MAELADALDLGSSVYDVQVQVLSSANTYISWNKHFIILKVYSSFFAPYPVTIAITSITSIESE